jgi:hypothetical protein
MAMTKVKPETSGTEVALADSPSEHYPYGTELTFEDELYDSIGMDGCEIDEEVMVTAKAKVVRKSERSSSQSGGEESESKSISLQILEVDVQKAPAEKDRAKRLYG